MPLGIKLTGRFAELSDEVHDLWFDANLLKGQSGQSTLRIPLSQKSQHPPVKMLVFRDVISLNVKDTQCIGWYDINRIEFDEIQQIATIFGNIPIEVAIQSTKELIVELESEATED